MKFRYQRSVTLPKQLDCFGREKTRSYYQRNTVLFLGAVKILKNAAGMANMVDPDQKESVFHFVGGSSEYRIFFSLSSKVLPSWDNFVN